MALSDHLDSAAFSWRRKVNRDVDYQIERNKQATLHTYNDVTLKVAVAAKAGRNNASVLENGKYSWSEVEAITLGDLLQQRFKQSLIDYLFLDVEGSEYDILPQLAHEMQVRKVTICQVRHFSSIHSCHVP